MFSALEIFFGNALYKFTFLLFTYLLDIWMGIYTYVTVCNM